MKLWRPLPSPFRFAPIVLAVACLPLLFWLWGLLAARVRSVIYDPGVFGLGLALSLTLMLLGTSLYLAYCMSRISYALDRQRLVIRCGGMAQVVPLSEIDAVYQPGKLINNRLVTVKQSTLNPSLPGYVVG